MVSIKKTLFILSLLFLQIQGVFAANFFGDSLKRFNSEIIGNESVQYFIIFAGILIMSFTIFKGALRFAFRSKEQYHQKEINVISFMMSIIGTSGLFFMFKDKGADTIIILFGGTFGLLFILAIAIIIMRAFVFWAHSFPEDQKRLRIPIYWYGITISFAFVGSYIGLWASKLFNLPDWIQVLKDTIDFLLPFLIIVSIYFIIRQIGRIFNWNEANKSPEQKNRDKTRNYLSQIQDISNNSELIMKQLTENMQNLNNEVNK